jgi:hypothetical protein
MQTFVILDVVGITLFAWFCLVKLIPSCNVSMYRYRLWRLRDCLADDVLKGSFQDTIRAQKLVLFIEAVIVLAPQLGPVKLGVMRWSSRHVPKSDDPFNLATFDPRDRKIVEARLNELAMFTARHILFGSPSGWILMFVLGVPALISSFLAYLLRGAPDGSSVIEGARHRVRDEIEADQALVLLGSRGASPRSVAQSV